MANIDRMQVRAKQKKEEDIICCAFKSGLFKYLNNSLDAYSCCVLRFQIFHRQNNK